MAPLGSNSNQNADMPETQEQDLSGYEELGSFDDYIVPELPAQYIVDDAVIEDNRIGQLLLRHRMLSLDQLEQCLDYQLEHPGSLLGEVVIEKGIATVEDIQGVLKLQLSELRLGQILLRTKCISQDQLDIALVDQENTGELLGSILIGFAFCTPEQINWAIDQQNKD
ncbi:MAG: hypothetical protein JWM80_4913 [Cyanobacteria bacterium RYN_339]|nr:hypothetical protein [Cyanobacteria bacterium RYN_339]